MTPLFKKALCGLLSTLIVVVNPPVYGYLVQPPVMIPQVVKMAVVGPMEVDVVTDDQGRVHRVRETRRVDAEGNLISRQVVDKFKIGKTRAKIVATYDADNNLTRLVEKYTTKVKGGKHVLKFVSTQFDENGNPLDRRKVTDKVVRDRSFSNIFRANLAYGPVGGLWALIDPNSFYKFSESQLGKIIRMTNQIIFTAVAAMTGNPFLVAGVQFLNTYANTGSLKAALIGAAIAFAAFVITAGIASFLQNVKLPASFSSLQSAANQFGSQLAQTVSPQTFSVQSLTQQVATRVAAQQFEQAFGKKLGAFGTAAILSFTIAMSGQLFGGSAAEAARLANPQYYSVNSMALRALAQGGIAEAFKNERGLGAQFARELSSNLTAGLSTGVVSQGFQQAGKTLVDTVKLFDLRTPAGRANAQFMSDVDRLGINKLDKVNVGSNNLIQSARVGNVTLAPISVFDPLYSKLSKVQIVDVNLNGSYQTLFTGEMDYSKVAFYIHGWNAGTPGERMLSGLEVFDRMRQTGYKGSGVLVMWDSKFESFNLKEGVTFNNAMENADNTAKGFYKLLRDYNQIGAIVDPNYTRYSISHSLGIRVNLGAMLIGASRGEQLVNSVVLFNPAAANNVLDNARTEKLFFFDKNIPAGEFSNAPKAVKGLVINVSSNNDSTLKNAYQIDRALHGDFNPALGLKGSTEQFKYTADNVRGIDATMRIDSQTRQMVGFSEHSSLTKSPWQQVKPVYRKISDLAGFRD